MKLNIIAIKLLIILYNIYLELSASNQSTKGKSNLKSKTHLNSLSNSSNKFTTINSIKSYLDSSYNSLINENKLKINNLLIKEKEDKNLLDIKEREINHAKMLQQNIKQSDKSLQDNLNKINEMLNSIMYLVKNYNKVKSKKTKNKVDLKQKLESLQNKLFVKNKTINNIENKKNNLTEIVKEDANRLEDKIIKDKIDTSKKDIALKSINDKTLKLNQLIFKKKNVSDNIDKLKYFIDKITKKMNKHNITKSNKISLKVNLLEKQYTDMQNIILNLNKRLSDNNYVEIINIPNIFENKYFSSLKSTLKKTLENINTQKDNFKNLNKSKSIENNKVHSFENNELKRIIKELSKNAKFANSILLNSYIKLKDDFYKKLNDNLKKVDIDSEDIKHIELEIKLLNTQKDIINSTYISNNNYLDILSINNKNNNVNKEDLNIIKELIKIPSIKEIEGNNTLKGINNNASLTKNIINKLKNNYNKAEEAIKKKDEELVNKEKEKNLLVNKISKEKNEYAKTLKNEIEKYKKINKNKTETNRSLKKELDKLKKENEILSIEYKKEKESTNKIIKEDKLEIKELNNKLKNKDYNLLQLKNTIKSDVNKINNLTNKYKLSDTNNVILKRKLRKDENKIKDLNILNKSLSRIGSNIH